MANEYLKYTSKDYNSIKTDLINAIPSITDLWTNTEDGDPGIVLVKLMSALGDMLSYNMDKQALEYYSSTVTQRKNAAKLFNLIGYKMHWYQSATNRVAIHNNIVTPYRYTAIPMYNDYITLARIQSKTQEQLDEMYALWEAIGINFNSFLAQEFNYDTYPEYYYTASSPFDVSANYWKQGQFINKTYDNNSAIISSAVISLAPEILSLTRTNDVAIKHIYRQHTTDEWAQEILTPDNVHPNISNNITVMYQLLDYSMTVQKTGTLALNTTEGITGVTDIAYLVLSLSSSTIPPIPLKPLGWAPTELDTGDFYILYTPISIQYAANGKLINYAYLFTNQNSVLVQEYDTWVQKNTLNIYTYICSPQKTINIKNGNRNDVAYIIEPTTASNVDSSNNYLGSTDDIKPGETHEFNVIQGTLNSIKFSPIRLRNNKFYFPETAIDEVHMWLSWKNTESGGLINSETFIDKTDNLLTVTDGNLYFEFGVDDFDNPYIELPSYWTDKIKDSVEFTVYYIRTSGVYGNITKDFLNTIEGISRGAYTITHPANTVPYIDSDGQIIALPGQHPQTAHEAYLESLNYVTTFNTLVTIYDFERFVKRQAGFANAYAVDGQRANDLNDAVTKEALNMSLAQLQSFYNEARVDKPSGIDTDITKLQQFYESRKQVKYSEVDSEQSYVPYSLNMHIVYGEFDTAMDYTGNHVPVDGAKIANMQNLGKKFWLYQLISNYTIDYVIDPITGNRVQDADGNYVVAHPDYESIFDVNGNGRAAHYLDEKFRDTKIVNVCPEYAGVRVFPWRCCGTIHLKNPVSLSTANKILETVMEHLEAAFHPANIQFGQKIKYMDVIDVVTSAHESIAYFDAGLNSRKLIDIDESADFTFFNNTSLMYYVQSPNGKYISEGNISDKMFGNNEEWKDPNTRTIPNPYYKILSIAPEYIIG